MSSFVAAAFQATVNVAAVGALGGDEVVVTASAGSIWPTGIGLLASAGNDANGDNVSWVSGRPGQQEFFYPIGNNLTLYAPQQFLSGMTDLILSIAIPPSPVYGFTVTTVFFNAIIPIVTDMYGGCTFDIRSLLPTNYATGARSIAGIADQGGY